LFIYVNKLFKKFKYEYTKFSSFSRTK